MNVVILGAGSDIAKELSRRFLAAGDTVLPWRRSEPLPDAQWDAVVCAMGVLNPIGPFFDTDSVEWERGVDSNTLFPLRLLRRLWKTRNPGASVCFFSGAGVSRQAKTYSAYAGSKAMLMKMTELLDDENADAKFFILGPGMVRTKIQQQTLAAGERADNIERVRQFMDAGDLYHGKGTPHERIYSCLRWCMAQPKEVVGGRNFYVPHDAWGDALAPHLKANRDVFKLRRFGGGF